MRPARLRQPGQAAVTRGPRPDQILQPRMPPRSNAAAHGDRAALLRATRLSQSGQAAPRDAAAEQVLLPGLRQRRAPRPKRPPPPPPRPPDVDTRTYAHPPHLARL